MAEKKQIPLRVSPQLYAQLAAWAEDDFRSLNGQIEYLLTQCVRWRRGELSEAGDKGTAPGEKEREGES